MTAGNTFGGPDLIHHCATELDLFEVNREAQAFTMHACDETTGGAHAMCTEGNEACNAKCDSNGCDWNVFRLSSQAENTANAEKFFGSVVRSDVEMTIDTSKPITVRTWYDKEHNSWNQELIQDGTKHPYPPVEFPSWTGQSEATTYDAITDEFCEAFDSYLSGDGNEHTGLGGNKRMVSAQNEGYVLVLSIWTEDNGSNPPMQWLDGTLGDEDERGAMRGRCSTNEWQWDQSPLTKNELMEIEVVYSDFRIGPMGTTVPTSDSSP